MVAGEGRAPGGGGGDGAAAAAVLHRGEASGGAGSGSGWRSQWVAEGCRSSAPVGCGKGRLERRLVEDGVGTGAGVLIGQGGVKEGRSREGIGEGSVGRNVMDSVPGGWGFGPWPIKRSGRRLPKKTDFPISISFPK